MLHIILVNKAHDPEVLRVEASCRDEEGEIKSLTVSSEAEFVEAVVDGATASFYVSLSDDLPAGFSEVTVTCVDSAN